MTKERTRIFKSLNKNTLAWAELNFEQKKKKYKHFRVFVLAGNVNKIKNLIK